MDPLPSTNIIFAMLIQLERQNPLLSPGFLDHNALSANSYHYSTIFGRGRGGSANQGGGRGSFRPVCTYCNCSGHTVEECHRKHDYPVRHPRFNPKHASVNAAAIEGYIFVVKEKGKEGESLYGPVFPFSKAQIESLMTLLHINANNSSSTGQNSQAKSNISTASLLGQH